MTDDVRTYPNRHTPRHTCTHTSCIHITHTQNWGWHQRINKIKINKQQTPGDSHTPSFLYRIKIISLYLFLNWFMFVHFLISTFRLFHSFTPQIETQKHFLVVRTFRVLKLNSPLKLYPPSLSKNNSWIFPGNRLFFALNVIFAVCSSTRSLNLRSFDCKNNEFVWSLYPAPWMTRTALFCRISSGCIVLM